MNIYIYMYIYKCLCYDNARGCTSAPLRLLHRALGQWSPTTGLSPPRPSSLLPPCACPPARRVPGFALLRSRQLGLPRPAALPLPSLSPLSPSGFGLALLSVSSAVLAPLWICSCYWIAHNACHCTRVPPSLSPFCGPCLSLHQTTHMR